MNQPSLTAAIVLSTRRKEICTGPLLANEWRPKNFAEAFALQQAVGLHFAGVTASDVAGWKCALPTEEKIVVGALYTSTVQQIALEKRPEFAPTEPLSVCKIAASPEGFALVEPELAFELIQDLPPKSGIYTHCEIDAAIGKVRLALELIQSRYDDPSQATFFDALADGLVNQGLWLGPELKLSDSSDLSQFDLSIGFADGRVEAQAGRHPNVHPRAGLYWLVNFLSEQGIGLRQGQQIITGSYAGLLKLPMDEEITLTYGNLGCFTVRFVEARPTILI